MAVMDLEVGRNIRALRKQQRHTQHKLSELSGVSADSIARYEYGTRRPRIEQILLLSSALITSPAYLLGCERDDETVDTEKCGEILRKLGYTDAAAKMLTQIITKFRR